MFFSLYMSLGITSLLIGLQAVGLANGATANNVGDPNAKIQSLRFILNGITDAAVAQLVAQLKAQGKGRISIPDLNEPFSTGSSFWRVEGQFNAYNGTFEDLTTLRRTQDVTVTIADKKVTVTFAFGVSKAIVKYGNYKLKYGGVTVSGNLIIDIDGISLYSSIEIDYKKTPCQTALQKVQISNLGKVKVNATGMGPLNKLLSKTVTWAMSKWKKEVVGHIENELRRVMPTALAKFDCEKYRII